MKKQVILHVVALLTLGMIALSGSAQEAWPTPDTVQIPDSAWKLWPDTKAAWQSDELHLPGEFSLSSLPVHEPTGGWNALDHEGIEVSLPSTVEQHFWGKLGLRPYTRNEYAYQSTDPEVKNGNYEGVSWWWRNVEVPAGFANKKVLLHIRGARQRVEIYVNHKLVGYDLIAETAFDTDISTALLPGKVNQIALRITNPGGRLDWRDYLSQKWGKEYVQKSPGFGGLDRGLTLTAHDAVYIADSWVLNKPGIRSIDSFATVHNDTSSAQSGTVRFSVVNREDGTVRVSASVPAQIPAHGNLDVSSNLSDPKAKTWELDSPNLYALRAEWHSPQASDTRTITFGYRWFEPRGVGSDAGLYLNGRRIRMVTAISWGFWGLNGLWPTPELARKEVTVAKQLGLNALNFHRNIGKEDVLAQQDELGLLRYMEPGGAQGLEGPNSGKDDPGPTGEIDTSGKGGDPVTFVDRYTAERTRRMVRMFRSHPSLVMYVVQNEKEPDLSKPQVWNVLHSIHSLDPSRIVAAKSGTGPRHQGWFQPYSDVALHDDGTGYSGWRDEHTVGGSGGWTDDLYQDPSHFTHRLDDPKEIVDWGEMLGAASPDNHALMVRQIRAAGGESYDLLDHQQIDEAYNKYLDETGLRLSFPKTDTVYDQIGAKVYEYWARVIESARLSDSNDILTISGWESTAIEDHSGIVDNLRNPKGDPRILAKQLAPLLPVVRPRGVVHSTEDAVLADIYLLNETGKPASGTLQLTLIAPDGARTSLGHWPAPAYTENHFVYPVQMGFKLPRLQHEGTYTLALTLEGEHNVENSETVQMINPAPQARALTHVALVGDTGGLTRQMQTMPNIQAERFEPGKHYDLILLRQQSHGRINHFDDGNRIANTEDEALYRSNISGNANSFNLHFGNLPSGAAKVYLYFAEVSPAFQTHRIFDVVVNHQTVLKSFDMVTEAHGTNIAVVKAVDTTITDGSLDVGPGNSKSGEPQFNAIKVEVGGKTFAYALGGEDYTDKSGLIWRSYIPESDLKAPVLDAVRTGTPLLILAGDVGAGTAAATDLAKAGVLMFDGSIATARAPWMGNWVLVGKHALFAGLPQQEVMHGDYQFGVYRCYGLRVRGPGVQVIAAYGRDHGRALGASIFSAPLGKGTVLFQGLVGSSAPVIDTRLLSNAIDYLVAQSR